MHELQNYDSAPEQLASRIDSSAVTTIFPEQRKVPVQPTVGPAMVPSSIGRWNFFETEEAAF